MGNFLSFTTARSVSTNSAPWPTVAPHLVSTSSGSGSTTDGSGSTFVRHPRVEPVTPLPMQAGSRGEAWHKRSCEKALSKEPEPQRNKRRRSENLTVNCKWPGCHQQMEERWIHQDGRAYTLNEFAWHYSQRPLSRKALNAWSDAPLAAAYCDDHLQRRANILKELAVTSPHQAASSSWLQMHPEDEQSTLDAISAWWEASKKLYADEHPLEPLPSDAMLNIANVYRVGNKRVSAKRDRYQYNAFNRDGNLARNRRLLIHGTRHANLRNILSQDLKLAGIEVNTCHGNMLGCGAYFADCFLKSLQYCDETSASGHASKWLLLVEVNVGNPLVFSHTTTDDKDVFEDGGLVTRPEITFARGRRYFRRTEPFQTEWLDDCLLPCDPSDQASDNPANVCGRELRFNEWVVRDSSLYRIRYLVQLTRNAGLNSSISTSK